MPLIDVYTLQIYRFRALDADDCETSGRKVRTDFPEFHWVLFQDAMALMHDHVQVISLLLCTAKFDFSRHTAKLLQMAFRGSMLNEQHLGPSSSQSFLIQTT